MNENEKNLNGRIYPMDGWYPVIFFNEKNLNGRIYTHASINPDVINNMKDKIDKKYYMGELGHPDMFVPLNNFSDISLSNVSHLVEEVEIHDNIMFAKIRMLDTKVVDTIVSVQLDTPAIVFRPRASGTINEDGTIDLKEIYSFDAVSVVDDAFKDMQDRYNIIISKLGRLPDLTDLEGIDKAYYLECHKNSNGKNPQL